ncbi:MAG: hypothetical protein U1F15_01770 [Burkholderiales bacterium]
MKAAQRGRFAVKPVVAALALAFAGVDAMADPTPTQLPGAGLVRAVNTGTTISSPSVGGVGFPTWCITAFCGQTGGVAGSQVFNGTLAAGGFPGSIQLNNAGTIARAVIRWGGNGGSLESYNPAGFNIGANATMYFTSSSTVTSAAVLNIDASGNPSQIFGRLISTADAKLGGATAISDGVNTSGGAAPAIFVANASGVIVGSTGEIHGPNGIALIGANLNGGGSLSTAEWDFVANNGAATSFLDVTGGQSTVDVRGFLYGGTVGINTNTPAAYVLLVGGNVMNTGNMFGSNVNVLAGMRAYGSASISDTVNGVSKVPVQRLFNVDTGAMTVGRNECTSGAACLEISMSGATFANDGSLSSTKVGGPGLITIGAAKGIRTGTLGDKNPLVGLYADSGIYTDVYEAGGNTEIYNVVRGYSLGTTLPFLRVNQDTGWNGDVTLNALTVGSAPSSITTDGVVSIRGVNVHIDSTINHTLTGITTNPDLNITSTNSLTTTAAVGARGDVFITNSGAGGINIGADVISNRDGGVDGSVFVTNSAAGSPTTISGGLYATGSTTGNVNVDVNGPLSIIGSIASTFYDVNITNNQNGATSSIKTTLFAGRDINITVTGPLDVDVGAPSGSGSAGHDLNITQNSLAAGNTTTIAGHFDVNNDINIVNNGGTSTKLYIDGTLHTFALYDGYSLINVFSGGDLRLGPVNGGFGNSSTSDVWVAANGLNVALTGTISADDEFAFMAPNALTKIYTSAVVTAPDVDLTVLNLRGVQDGGAAYTSVGQKPTTQFVTNDFNVVATGTVNSPITGNTNWLTNQMQIKAMNAGSPVFVDFSAVGGGFQTINLGVTGDVILTSGATGTPFSIVGFATPLIFVPPLVANGGSQLIVNASGNMDVNGVAGPGFPLAPVSFQFPGGVALKAGGYLSLNTPLYNAWTLSPAPYQGVFFEAPTIIASGYVATNPGSWVNYSSYPVTGPSNTYSINQVAPTLFQFVSTPEAIHNNTFSLKAIGQPFCTTPNPPSPWAPGC